MKFKDMVMLDEAGLENWDADSMRKFSKTIGKNPTEKGFFDACVTRMGQHFTEDQAKGFCAKLKDKAYNSTYWRGKDQDDPDKPKSRINWNKK